MSDPKQHYQLLLASVLPVLIIPRAKQIYVLTNTDQTLQEKKLTQNLKWIRSKLSIVLSDKSCNSRTSLELKTTLDAVNLLKTSRSQELKQTPKPFNYLTLSKLILNCLRVKIVISCDFLFKTIKLNDILCTLEVLFQQLR